MKNLLDIKTASRLSGISSVMLGHYINTDRLPAFKMGGAWIMEFDGFSASLARYKAGEFKAGRPAKQKVKS